MIASSRVEQLQSEILLEGGISDWIRGEEGPNAVAAGRILAETLIYWHRVLKGKMQG